MQTRGMTLLEAMIWIGVFTAAMLALTSWAITFYKTNRYTLAQATAVASAQHGIDETVRTIREAGYGADGAYPVISMADDEFDFYADVNEDGFVDKVRFYIENTELKRGVVEPDENPPAYTASETVTVVSEDVRNTAESVATFTYFDAEGAEISDLSQVDDVRFVTVRLVVDSDTAALPEAITLISSAALRNVR